MPCQEANEARYVEKDKFSNSSAVVAFTQSAVAILTPTLSVHVS